MRLTGCEGEGYGRGDAVQELAAWPRGHGKSVVSPQSSVHSHQSSVHSPVACKLGAVLAVFSLQMSDQTGQHLGDLFVQVREVLSFRLRDVTALHGNSKLGPDLVARTAGAIKVAREVPIGALGETFRDDRDCSFRRGADLIAEASIFVKTRPRQDCRNCMGGSESFLINEQFFDTFRVHASSDAEPMPTADCRLPTADC